MSEIYGEFGIEIYDTNLKLRVERIMRQIAEINIMETKRDTIIFDYVTPIVREPYIEIVSDILCNKLEPFIEILSDFYSIYKEKCYMGICFVVNSDKNGVVIKINERLLKLATALGVEIQFDGV